MTTPIFCQEHVGAVLVNGTCALCIRTDFKHFRMLVRLMRSHQKAWFKDKHPSDLAKSKGGEQRIDQELEHYDSPRLF